MRTPVVLPKFRKLLAQSPGRHTLEGCDQLGYAHRRWILHEQMNMLGFSIELNEVRAKVGADGRKDLRKAV